MANEIQNIKEGDIVIAAEPGKITIGKLKTYKHPYVTIHGVQEAFAENIVYKADQERLMLVGVPEALSEGIMSGRKSLPVIGED